jgi:hypothetical protein
MDVSAVFRRDFQRQWKVKVLGSDLRISLLTESTKQVVRKGRNHPSMTTKRTLRLNLRVKGASAVIGLLALIALGALAVAFNHDGPPAAALAGSGDAPTNTEYTQPSVTAMNMGASATWTAPPSVEATTLASPVIKAAS